MGSVPVMPDSRITYAVGVERALHHPEIGCTGPALGDPLNGYAVANGLFCANQGDHYKRR